MHLTKSELEAMEVFWRVNEPLSQTELLACSDEKSWKDRSVYILLNGLLSKGALTEVGFVRSGKTFARRFAPTLSFEEYCVRSITANKHVPDLPKLLAVLMKTADVTVQDLDEMQRLLEEERARLAEKKS